MYVKLITLLLLLCQIILNESSVIHESPESDERVTTPIPQPSDLPSGYVRFPDIHAAYKLHEDVDTTWYEARDLCVAENAHLAIVDSVEKIRRINRLKTSTYKWLHVGILHKNSTDQWIRIDNGEPLTNIPWKEHNPDGTGHCAGISITDDGLVDYKCDWGEEYFVCEIAI